MNERIKRILEHADISMSMTEFSGCLEGQDYLVTDSNLSEMQLEKFAELIVRECAKVCETTTEEGQPLHLVSLGYAQRVKQHFGVEE